VINRLANIVLPVPGGPLNRMLWYYKSKRKLSMPTAYSYIRFSSKIQSEGDSERRQLARTLEYCKSKNLTLSDKTYADLGISAFKEVSRPSLSDMLEAIDNNSIKKGDFIVLENLDRLSRQGISHTQEVINAILKKGVNLTSLQDNLELVDGSQNDLIPVIRIAVSADLAYQESKKKSERIKAAWNQKQLLAIKSGIPKTNKCPAWLTLSKDRSKYEVVAEKVKVVQDIFKMLSNGIGKKKVAYILNQEQRKHISELKRSTGVWYPSYIDKICKSYAVLGHFIPTVEKDGKRVLDNSNKVEGYFPNIISEELFYKVRKMRELNAKSQGRKGEAFSNLLQGVSFCKDCAGSMQYMNKGKGDKYLKCSQSVIGLCENTVLFRYGLLEYAVLDLFSSNELQKYLKPPAPTDYSTTLKTLKLDIEKQKDELGYLLSLDSTSVVRAKITPLNESLKTNEGLLEQTEQDEVNEKLNTFDSSANLPELVSKIIQGDISIRANVNSYLRRKCKLVFDGEEKQVVLSILTKFMKKDKYLKCAWLRMNKNGLIALTYNEDEVVDISFELTEINKIVTKIAFDRYL
jgi:DNA invertase Pin-like site-specific DNA recombinase